MKGRLQSIETMGLLDGPGTRTIFFCRCALYGALTATTLTQSHCRG